MIAHPSAAKDQSGQKNGHEQNGQAQNGRAQNGQAQNGQEGPTPLWLSIVGLCAAVGFASAAAYSGSNLEVISLLVGAAASGGLGLFGLFERALRGKSGVFRVSTASFADPIWETAPEPMAFLDRFGRITKLNAAARIEIGAGVQPTRIVDLICDRADASSVVYQLMRDAQEGERSRRQMMLRRAGGRPGLSVVDVWSDSKDGVIWRWCDDIVKESAFESQNSGAEIGGCQVNLAGRVVEANVIFARWLNGGQADGARPSFRSVAPAAAEKLSELRKAIASGQRAFIKPFLIVTEIVGGPAAPNRASMLIAPKTDGSGFIVLAAPFAGAMIDADAPAFIREDGVAEALSLVGGERLFQDAPVGFLVMSQDGKILKHNAAADTILTNGGIEMIAQRFDVKNGRSVSVDSLAGLVGDFFVDWIHEYDRDEAAKRLRAEGRGLSSGGPAFEARLVDSRGNDQRAAHCHFSRIDTAKGRLLLAYIIDASALQEMRRIRIKSQRLEAIGELSAGVAHDFNNMIFTIKAYCETLQSNISEDHPAFQDALGIYSAASRMARLTKQLLYFSRRQTCEPEIADLSKETNDLIGLFRRGLGEKITIIPNFDPELWRVKVDPGHYMQVVANLLFNAKDAMNKDGLIRVATQNLTLNEEKRYPGFAVPPGDWVVLEVADQGCGIPEEKLSEIFEPFVTTKEVGEGTGLGLSTVYGVVKQNSGYIAVESRVGEGTIFRAYFPRTDETPTKPALPVATRRTENLVLPAEAEQSINKKPVVADTDIATADDARTDTRTDESAETSPVPAKASGALLTKTLALLENVGGGEPREVSPSNVVSMEKARTGRLMSPADPSKQTILLVEDEDVLRKVIARHLVSRGYHVLEADCGEAALEILRTDSRIDLLLSDVIMPGIDGPAVLKEYGSERPELPIIFMTGHARDAFGDFGDGDPTGGRKYVLLEKPIELHKLVEAVNTSMSGAVNRRVIS